MIHSTSHTAHDEQPSPTIEIPKNDFSCLRVCRSVFKGHEFIDVRTFVKNDSGEFIPTKKGITVNPEQVDMLIRALRRIGIDDGDSE